ncbi:hypothetical protein [Burkholderia gladioli]|uniref:hypothetical protein n=1 Tax=Burkholderia gladioli TaxID=28095 RepID=UPI00163FB106|nr:hypothetical protein [Burkholderia gladioli]
MQDEIEYGSVQRKPRASRPEPIFPAKHMRGSARMHMARHDAARADGKRKELQKTTKKAQKGPSGMPKTARIRKVAKIRRSRPAEAGAALSSRQA